MHVMAGDVDLTCSSRSGRSNCCGSANGLGHSFLNVDIRRPVIVVVAVDLLLFLTVNGYGRIYRILFVFQRYTPTFDLNLDINPKASSRGPHTNIHTQHTLIFIRTVTEDRMLEVVSHSFSFGAYTVNVDSYPRSGLDGRCFLVPNAG